MNILKFYHSRKYLLRILISLSLFITILLFLTIFAISYTYENKALKVQHEANEKVLHQVDFNISYMHEMVLNLTMSTYFNNQVKALRNAESIEVHDLYLLMMRLKEIVYSNPFLYSLVVYNTHTDCYYSTENTMGCEEDGMNQAIDEYLTSQDEIPKLQLIPMSLNGKISNRNSTDFFSFYMYDSDSFSKEDKSILIVNINPEWLFDNINELNRKMDNVNNQILIMDKDANLVDSNAQIVEQEEAVNHVRGIVNSSEKTSDYVIDEMGHERMVTSYSYSPKTEWSIVNIQPLDAIVSQIKDTRLVIIYILISILGSAIIGTIMISHRLYKPVSNLIQEIKGSQLRNDEFENNDELTVISNEFQRSVKEMKKMKENENFSKKIINNYFLRKLIIDSSLNTPEEYKDNKHSVDLTINLDQPLLLGIIKIDEFSQYNNRFANEEKKIIEFSIGNIIQETIGKNFPNEITKMRKDHFVFLLNINPNDQQMTQLVEKLLKQAQFNFYEHYDLSLSITISSPILLQSEITHTYIQTLEQSMYRLIYGHQSLITPKMVESNEQNVEFYYPEQIEKNIIEGLRANQPKQIQEQLISLSDHITTLNYNNMMYAIIHTFVLVEKTIREVNQHHVFQFGVNLREYYDKLLEKETLNEVFKVLYEMIEEIYNVRKEVSENDKSSLLVETVKEVIEDSYTDLNLSLQGIASNIGISSAYLSKVFRSQVSMSVGDYIKDVRLTHGARMLEENKYTVNKIIELTGFGNQSYFYKVFKKKFGVTPKEYQQSKLLNQ